MSASREVKPKTGDPIQGEAYIHWAQLGNMRMEVSASDTGADPDDLGPDDFEHASELAQARYEQLLDARASQ